jgi:hypothetical protein
VTTYCQDCEHVHPAANKADEPWRWRCLKVPVAPGYGFVSQDYSPDPPYARCSDVNRNGECEMYETRRVAPEEADGKED